MFFNSIGKLLPGIEMKILDADDNSMTPILPQIANTQLTQLDCSPGQAGELCIRGPNIMQGYVRPEGIMSSATTDDFMRTGDIGYADKEGYVYLVDRAKEMIKVKG